MALLQVRDFPQDLYERIGQAAATDRRSVAQETVVLLRDALNLPESNTARRRRAVAEAIRMAQATPPNDLDPVALIRQDRSR